MRRRRVAVDFDVEIRVPVVSEQPTGAKNVVVRDRQMTYVGPRSVDHEVRISIGSVTRLYLVAEEAVALLDALDRWRVWLGARAAREVRR